MSDDADKAEILAALALYGFDVAVVKWAPFSKFLGYSEARLGRYPREMTLSVTAHAVATSAGRFNASVGMFDGGRCTRRRHTPGEAIDAALHLAQLEAARCRRDVDRIDATIAAAMKARSNV